MRRGTIFASAALAILCGCGAAAGSTRPHDQRLAARIAPTAAILGPTWKPRSPAQVGSRGGCVLLPHATGCAIRFFALPGAPPPVSNASALVDIFGTARRASAAYATAAHRLAKPHAVDRQGIHETISLRGKSTLALGRAYAMLFVYRVAMTSPRRLVSRERTILMREGRAELLLIYTTGHPVAFQTTVRRLATRMRPALH